MEPTTNRGKNKSMMNKIYDSYAKTHDTTLPQIVNERLAAELFQHMCNYEKGGYCEDVGIIEKIDDTHSAFVVAAAKYKMIDRKKVGMPEVIITHNAITEKYLTNELPNTKVAINKDDIAKILQKDLQAMIMNNLKIEERFDEEYEYIGSPEWRKANGFKK